MGTPAFSTDKQQDGGRLSNKERLVGFLKNIVVPGTDISQLKETDDLVGSGIMDSLAMTEIIGFLEEEFGIDFTQTGITTEQFNSIESMLGLIAKLAQ